MTHLVVRPEAPADYDAVAEVNRLAFGGDGEAALVDALRAGGYARLSLVAEAGGTVVGHVLFSRLPIEPEGGGIIEALALAPVAVRPSFQRRGIGTRLVEEGLRVCKERGHRAVVVLGHPEFYRRFGFSADLARLLASPFSGEAWMALDLTPGALAGVAGRVQYPPPFGRVSG